MFKTANYPAVDPAPIFMSGAWFTAGCRENTPVASEKPKKKAFSLVRIMSLSSKKGPGLQPQHNNNMPFTIHCHIGKEIKHICSNCSRGNDTHDGGVPKVMVMVGISFGLLCVLQSVLNISLRLRSERDQPFQDKDLLLQENEEMKEQIRQLLKRNQELQDKNKNLRDEMKVLTNQINILLLICRAVTPSCPEGWTMYRTSCYQISNTTNTWDHAKQDCEQKGAHLVILNDQEEEGVLRLFDGCTETWIGLRAEKGCFRRSAWTWVDGTKPTYNKWNGDVSSTGKRCVFLQNGPLLLNWMQDSCLNLHNWMCEKAVPK